MLGKVITIDEKNKEDYPKIVDKEIETGNPYIYFYLEDKDNKIYKAQVENVTSKGNYRVRVIERI